MTDKDKYWLDKARELFNLQHQLEEMEKKEKKLRAEIDTATPEEWACFENFHFYENPETNTIEYAPRKSS